MARDNVLLSLIQSSLQRAYPSAPASNQVLQQVSSANDTITYPDTVSSSEVTIGYPYGYGEEVNNWASGTPSNVDVTTVPNSMILLRQQSNIMMWGIL